MATVTKACLIVMGLGLAWAYPPELGGEGEDLDDHRPYRGFSSYRGFNSYRGKTYTDPDDHKPYRGFSSYRGLNSYRGKTDSKPSKGDLSEPSRSEVTRITKTSIDKCDAIENTEVSSVSCQTDEDCLSNCESCPCLPLCCPCCRCTCSATYCQKNTCVFCTTCSDDTTNSTKKGESPNAPLRGLTKLREPSLEPSQGQQFPVCAQIDAPCTSDDTCCSKNCEYFVPPGCHLSGTAGHPVPNQETNCNVTKFEHVCRPSIDCIEENEQCLEDEDCCDDSLCITAAGFVRRCRKPPGKCIPENEECKAGDDCCDEGAQCTPTNNRKVDCGHSRLTPNSGVGCGNNVSLCIIQSGKECVPENDECKARWPMADDCCEGFKCTPLDCENGEMRVGCGNLSLCIRQPDCVPNGKECWTDMDCCERFSQCIPKLCPPGSSKRGCCHRLENENAPRSLTTTDEEAGAPSKDEQTLNKLFEAMMRRLQSGKSIKFKVDVKNPEAILGSEDNSARSFY